MPIGNQPPEWPLKFLAWFCPEHLLEEIEGDLYERFYYDNQQYNNSRSRRRFIWNTIRFCRPGIVKRNTVNSKFGLLVMFNSNLKIATRVILRNKLVSAFSIVGLMLGLTGALLLGLKISNDFSFDSYHEDVERLYKVYNQQEYNGEISTWDYTPRILGPTLKSDFTFIEKSASYAKWNEDYLFTAGKKKMINQNGVFTDADFIEMFSFKFLSGTKESALNEPNSIILTESFARMLFDRTDVLDEDLSINSDGYSFDFKVTGVLADLPGNTNFNFDYIIGFRFIENIYGIEENWQNHSVLTFVKLTEDIDLDLANNEVRDVAKIHSNKQNETDIFLYPLERVHMHGRFENGQESGGRIVITRILILLAFSMVLIACINFINISTARAQKRSREIGVRKVIGAAKGALVTQFLFESVLMVLIAGIGALLLATYLMPYFSSLLSQPVSIPWSNPQFWVIVLVCIIFTGVLSGAYPSAYLSSLMPVDSLSSSNGIKAGKGFVRKALVVVQFGFAVMMIFSTLVIQKQINYLQNRQAGYDKENLVYHQLTAGIDKNFVTYKERLLNTGYVEAVSRTSAPLTDQFSSTSSMTWPGKEEDESLDIERFMAGDNIIETIGLEIVKGREMDISKYASDSSAALLNETTANAMGLDNPIGAVIIDDGREWTVVGVVKDFVLYNPQGDIPYMILFNGASSSWFNGVHIRLDKDKPTEQALIAVGKTFSELDADYPFDYTFIDNAYEAKFSGIKRTQLISTIFGVVIIVIACAGLFALSLYLISRKLKEIGVRKVFGSSTGNIIRHLCWDSLKPILVAILIFSPVAWFSMDWWLKTYPYRISLDVTLLLGAGIILITIALVTVIYQTARAASTNPVNVLRSE